MRAMQKGGVGGNAHQTAQGVHFPHSGDYNIVMSHVRNIREKIEDNPSKPIYIQTVWGVGYRFNKNISSGL